MTDERAEFIKIQTGFGPTLPGWGHAVYRTNVRVHNDCLTIGTKMSPRDFKAPDGFVFLWQDGDYAIYKGPKP